MIGVIIPGIPTITGGPINDNMITTIVKEPKNIPYIGLFQSEKISDDSCVALYYSTPPFEQIYLIGCTSNLRQSEIFYTGWNLDPIIVSYSQISLVVKIEKLINIKKDFDSTIHRGIYKEMAKKILKHFYNYLLNLNQNHDKSKNFLIIPLNSPDTWYKNFLQKFKISELD